MELEECIKDEYLHPIGTRYFKDGKKIHKNTFDCILKERCFDVVKDYEPFGEGNGRIIIYKERKVKQIISVRISV